MKEKPSLILCASGHIPLGAGETEYENLYSKEIKPLISSLDKFPDINIAFHYSGVLLYWIERRHPEFFMLLGDLLNRKQAELLGGGFYNPMLSIIPSIDKIGQMEMLTTYLRKHFGKRPLGCWLPPMSWEQSLVSSLNACGMNYVFLEEEMFLSAGVKAGEGGFFYPCITEDQGSLIIAFPIARKAGNDLCSNGFENKINKIHENLSKENKTGRNGIALLPITNELYEPNFYDGLFEKLSSMNSEFEFNLPSRIYKNLKDLKKVYFSGRDSDCSNPRHFLANYPEAGGIYAKSVYVHTLIKNRLRGDKARKRIAFEELWKAQDSGLFRIGCPSSSGLFHSSVRKAAYRALLESEKLTREKGKFHPSLSLFDYDLDGEGEYIFQDEKVNCCITTRGASVFELDYLPASWNYLDTMSLNPGTERRNAFNEWLAPENLKSEDINSEGIRGGYFCGNDTYDVLEMDRIRRLVKFRLVPDIGGQWADMEIQKNWQLKKNILTLEYVLRNTGDDSKTFSFCPQMDLSFPGMDDKFIRLFSLREDNGSSVREAVDPGEIDSINEVKILEFQDIVNETIINLESNKAGNCRIFNIFNEEGGYQSTSIIYLFPVSIDSGKTWKLAFSLKMYS